MIEQIAENFWNLRGSLRIAGLVDIGTQASLVRLRSGRFVMLDSLTPDAQAVAAIKELTDGGKALDAVLNLHPFHTLHVAPVHALFPGAQLYGTQRHLDRFPDLPWAAETTDSAPLHALFADDLEFSVPAGVDFISADEKVHFASVLAYHPDSRVLHVDDTFNYLPASGLLRLTPWADSVSLHPTLSRALERRAGAGADFHGWAEALIARWSDAAILCAAHNGVLNTLQAGSSPPLSERLNKALERVEETLGRHEQRYS